MSASIAAKNKLSAEKLALEKTQQAVNWKIFEVQASLIDEDADSKDLINGRKWLQPRHFLEIIEERTTDGRCGWPLCNNELAHEVPTSPEPGQRLRIAYKDKKIYEVGNSELYCCVDCVTKVAEYQVSLSNIAPVARPGADRLVVKAKGEGVNAVLDILFKDENKKTFSDKSINSYTSPSSNNSKLSKKNYSMGEKDVTNDVKVQENSVDEVNNEIKLNNDGDIEDQDDENVDYELYNEYHRNNNPDYDDDGDEYDIDPNLPGALKKAKKKSIPASIRNVAPPAYKNSSLSTSGDVINQIKKSSDIDSLSTNSFVSSLPEESQDIPDMESLLSIVEDINEVGSILTSDRKLFQDSLSHLDIKNDSIVAEEKPVSILKKDTKDIINERFEKSDETKVKFKDLPGDKKIASDVVYHSPSKNIAVEEEKKIKSPKDSPPVSRSPQKEEDFERIKSDPVRWLGLNGGKLRGHLSQPTVHMKPGKAKTVDWVDPTPNGLIKPAAKMNRMVLPNMKLGLSKFLSTTKNTIQQQQDNIPTNVNINTNPIISKPIEVKETIVNNMEEFKQNKLVVSKSSPSIIQSNVTEVKPNPPPVTDNNKIIKENKPNPLSNLPVKSNVIEKKPLPPTNIPVKKAIFSNNIIEEKSSNKSSISNVVSTNKPFEEDKKDKIKKGGKIMEFNIVERTDSIVQESKWDRNQSTEVQFDEEDEEEANYVNNYDDESKTLKSIAADGAAADAMMIDGYVVDIQQLRVAPETTMKNLSFDPFSSIQSSNSLDLSKMSEHDRAIWLEVFGTDQIEEEVSIESNYVPEDRSLFIIIWQVLDDLFGHVECDNILSGKIETKISGTNPLVRHDGLDTYGDERLTLDAGRQCSNDAQYQFLLRGVSIAEKTLGLNRLLNKENKDGNLQVYDLCKTQLLGSVYYPEVCPALNNSQWSLVGLLIIEAICKRRDLITGINDGSNKEWDQKINMVVASLLGGGKKATKILRDSELTKLRDFWDEYAYRY